MKERWKVIPEWPQFKVSNFGRVWSIRAGRLLTPVLNARGYLCVCFSVDNFQRTIRIHQLVLGAFIGPRPDGQQGRHLDGDKLNNRLDNLRWGTAKENYEDQLDHGTSIHTRQKGSGNHASKLTDADVREIRRLVASGMMQTVVADLFGVSRATICLIVNRKHWPHLVA